jgi:nucleotidyltransferase substrate binding protein (TIGR01987 family)
LNLIDDGNSWMDMLASRNKTSQTYNRETAQEICQAVKNDYFSLFQKLETRLDRLKKEADKA